MRASRWLPDGIGAGIVNHVSAPCDRAEAEEIEADPLQGMTLGYLISLVARLMAQSLKARNGSDGMAPGQYPVALELLARDGLSQRDLCEAVRIEQATMANTLKRMERDGLITRRPSVADGRQATIHLTARGAALTQAAVQNVMDINRLALADLDHDTSEVLRGILSTMARRLEQDPWRGSPSARP